jgi:hypothetical protein
MASPADLEQPLARIAALVQEMEEAPDRAMRERARGLVQAVLDIHRVGLERLLAVAAARDDGAALVDALAREDAFALLLALHGLHPRTIDARVRGAIDDLAPRLLADGVAIELRDVTDELARVRLRPVGPVRTTGAALRARVETAIGRSAPDIGGVEIEGLESSDVPASRLTGPRES